MKQLVISIKAPGEALNDFKRALKKARTGKLKPTSEISFDNRKDFNRFIENLHILSSIRAHKPRSVYELAKRSGVDVSNLNKIILFFEEMGVVRIKKETVSGRRVRRPVVDYDRIEFKLAG
jgi:predicted transcriptional regulator